MHKWHGPDYESNTDDNDNATDVISFAQLFGANLHDTNLRTITTRCDAFQRFSIEQYLIRVHRTFYPFLDCSLSMILFTNAPNQNYFSKLKIKTLLQCKQATAAIMFHPENKSLYASYSTLNQTDSTE